MDKLCISNEINDDNAYIHMLFSILPSPIFTIYLINYIFVGKLNNIYLESQHCTMIHILIGILFIFAGLLIFYGIFYYNKYINNPKKSILNIVLIGLMSGIICIVNGINLLLLQKQCDT